MSKMITYSLRTCTDIIKPSAPLQLSIQNNHLHTEDMHRHQIISSTSDEHPGWSLTFWEHAQTSSNHQLHFSWTSRMITYFLRTCIDIIKSSASFQMSIQNDHLHPEGRQRHHQIISSTSDEHPEWSLTYWGHAWTSLNHQLYFS